MVDTDKIFIKGLELNLFVGIYAHEKAAQQRVIVHAIFEVESNQSKILTSIDDVVSYEKSVEIILSVGKSRHYDLLEELAEDIVNNLSADKRIIKITLSLEKPDIINNTQGVGIEITRVFNSI